MTQNFKIIDAHTHIFPSKIASRAVDSISRFYSLEMESDGTSETLIKNGEAFGVEKFLVCSTATKPEQVIAINDFVYSQCQKYSDKFIGFATLHPFMDNIESEIERIINLGFKGIKLHPDFQEFNIDDEKAMRLYKLVEGKLFILFHTGDDRYDFSSPTRLARATDRFPDLKCIAAHFGGYKRWDEAMAVYKSSNIFMDTSSSMFILPKKKIYQMFETFGIERFFFGTDYPMWSYKHEIDIINSLDLSKSQKQAIYYDNFYNAVLK